MRLVFFGTGRFAVPALQALAGSISLVVTQPDRPSGRGMRPRPSPVKEVAGGLGLRIESPMKCRDPEFIELVRRERPDALLVAAYGQILPMPLLESATKGGINLHASVLPKYRGAAPIQRAILAGETATGISLIQMDKGMDSGDLIAVVGTHIGPDETYGDLETRLAEIAARIAADWVPTIVRGDYPRAEQNHSGATYAPKVEKSEAELSPARPGDEEYDRFRAFTPSPGAFLRSRWGLLRISKARRDLRGGEPGTILNSSASLLIAFSRGSIELLELQPEGKKKMTGLDFANGVRLQPGTRVLQD